MSDITSLSLTEIVKNIKEKIRILEEHNLLTYEKIILSPIDELKCKITRIFKLFDELDIWMEIDWFLNLNLEQTIKINEEIHNIWGTFITDNPEMVKNVLNGKNPFNCIKYTMDIIEAKDKLLNVFEGFVTNGINKQSKLTGAIIVIGGFSFVSEQVKERFKDFLVFN